MKTTRKTLLLTRIAAAIILAGAFIAAGFLLFSGNEAEAGYPELREIQEKQIASFTALSKYFTRLAEKKGAEYAFRVLAVAPLPPNTDLHLLGHGIGDALYKQKGLEGIKICTQDFRNACSHSIVVGLLIEKGEGQDVFSQINAACKQAPGGKGAYTMCFHGLGHGVLAYTGYDLPKAIQLCDKTGTDEYQDREAIECIGGTIMEIISGGFHNQELWAVQSKKYLPEHNPLYPCSAGFMPEKARAQCYTYLTPRLFTAAGGTIDAPAPENFKKAFMICGRIPASQPGNRAACYGGFGKEFVALGKNRDIRNIDRMTAAEMSLVIEWCNLANTTEGIRSCLTSAESSLYWGGENDRRAVIGFCGLIENQFMKDGCFADIIDFVRFYMDDRQYRSEFCGEIPAQYGEACREHLL